MAITFDGLHDDLLDLIIERLAPVGYLDDRTLQPLASHGLADVQRSLHRMRLVSRRIDELAQPIADKHLGHVIALADRAVLDSSHRLIRWLQAQAKRPEMGAGVRMISLEADEAISDDADLLAPDRAADIRADAGYGTDEEAYSDYASEDYEQAYQEERTELVEAFADMVERLLPLCPGVRLLSADNILYLDRPHVEERLIMPSTCDTLRLPSAHFDNDKPLGDLLSTPGVSRLTVGGGLLYHAIDIGLALTDVTHLNALVGTTLRSVPLDCPLVSLSLTFRSMHFVPAAHVIANLSQLRCLALRFEFGVGSGRSTTTMSGDFGAVWRALGATSAERVLFAYARKEVSDACPPLSQLINGLAGSLVGTMRFQRLLVEAAGADLEEASAALAKLRKACEAIGVRLDIEAVGS